VIAALELAGARRRKLAGKLASLTRRNQLLAEGGAELAQRGYIGWRMLVLSQELRGLDEHIGELIDLAEQLGAR
jgi:hypothetical protein